MSDDMDGYLASIQAQAAAATGLSVQELLERAEDLGKEIVLPPRLSRLSAQARRIPELHLRHMYDRDPVECDALRFVREFMASKSTLLVLAGGVGTRKTGSAAWALLQCSGLFIRADELGQIAAGRDEQSIELGRTLKRCDLLVLDDLGSEYADDKGWFVRAFSGLINARYEGCLKTIVTCNLTGEQFKATYGERIADRIRETGRFVVIAGESVRRKP